MNAVQPTAMTRLTLNSSEQRFLLHMLEAPDALLGDEEGAEADEFEARCAVLAGAIQGAGCLDALTALDMEILRRAAEENTYMADAACEDPRTMTMARLTKVANALESKLAAALGRAINIPRS